MQICNRQAVLNGEGVNKPGRDAQGPTVLKHFYGPKFMLHPALGRLAQQTQMKAARSTLTPQIELRHLSVGFFGLLNSSPLLG